MNSSHRHRRPRKIRRTGRHTRPSQTYNVAEAACKAAPAVAIAGALVATPQVYTAAKVPAQATVAEQIYAASPVPTAAAANAGQVHADALVIHHEPARRYTVRPGDTLSSIAQRFYDNPADWPWLYQANRSVIHNPDVIYAGEVLNVPYGPPASGTTSTPAVLTTSATLSGTLSCPGLEELWDEAGGSGAQAVTAASIAMAESGGQQYATGLVGERGYWQINPDHGSLSSYEPLANAKAAVIISDDGTNWTPWTTYTSGAYQGRC